MRRLKKTLDRDHFKMTAEEAKDFGLVRIMFNVKRGEDANKSCIIQFKSQRLLAWWKRQIRLPQV